MDQGNVRVSMVSDFEKRVLDLVAYIPKGRITTYKELARAAGSPRAIRAVGNSLNKNPWAPKVPCHRVVKSNGKVGGFAQGKEQKIKLLKQEAVDVQEEDVVKFSQIIYIFK